MTVFDRALSYVLLRMPFPKFQGILESSNFRSLTIKNDYIIFAHIFSRPLYKVSSVCATNMNIAQTEDMVAYPP
jgi:hypothetical protein